MFKYRYKFFFYRMVCLHTFAHAFLLRDYTLENMQIGQEVKDSVLQKLKNTGNIFIISWYDVNFSRSEGFQNDTYSSRKCIFFEKVSPMGFNRNEAKSCHFRFRRLSERLLVRETHFFPEKVSSMDFKQNQTKCCCSHFHFQRVFETNFCPQFFFVNVSDTSRLRIQK